MCVVGNDTGVMLFGGMNVNESLDDTWTWDGASWTQQMVPGPSARSAAATATLHGTVVLFGGSPNVDASPPAAVLGDTWTWDGTAWTQQNVTGPSPRAGAAMATLGNTVVLFGGGDEHFHQMTDTWSWDGSTWAQLTVTGPEARSGASMATLNNAVVMFGGMNLPAKAAPRILGDTWTWNGTSWKQQSVVGPDARSVASASTLGGVVVLFGGAEDCALAGDTWTWNGSSWKQQEVTGPSAREDASAATMNGNVVLFGGTTPCLDVQDDTWTWDGATWKKVNVAGPSTRYGAAMATVGGP
jgi:N-acetylneuraminic acid mutarotase